MKKNYMLAALAFGLSFMTNIWSQVSITYQVDISNAGLTLASNGMRIGGNFTDLGVSNLPNWTPSDPSCAMTDIGNGIWSITVNYPCSSIGQTQLFKFVNGDWGSNEGASDLAACGQNDGQGGFNRSFVIPNSNSTIGFKYDNCTSIATILPNVCTINPPNLLNDVSPANNSSLPSAEYGKPYQTSISFNFTNAEGTPVINPNAPINSYQITNISFSGNGFGFQQSQNSYNGGESGCLSIYGVSRQLGRFNLQVEFTYYVVVGFVGAVPTTVVRNYIIDVLPSLENTNNTVICQGDELGFSTQLGCGLVYQWKNFNTPIQGANTPSFSPAQSGSYTVEISNLTNNLTLSSLPINVTVNSNPQALISPAGATTFCQGDTVVLNANTGPNLSYQWLRNNGNINGANSSSLTANLNGSYTVSVTNSTGCTTVSSPISISLYPQPNVTLSVFNPICDTLSNILLIGGSPSGGIYTGTSVNNNNFNPSIGVGTYPISYSFTDLNGCSASVQQNLTVVACGSADLNSTSINDYNIYPNPTNDKFTLNVSNDLLGKAYVITDFSGRIISQGKINALIQTIDVQEISKGSYFLQIDKSTAKAIKIIKQ